MHDNRTEKFLAAWMRHVSSRDVEGVLGLYDEHAVLVPTFSNRLLGTRERIREYFAALCEREQLGIELHGKPRIVTRATDDIVALCGIYRWRFTVDEELLNFEARFSYFLDFARPAPILHHHSSQIPRML